MISMKCFFVFIVIIVLTWNSIVYANEKWKNAKNVYEFKLKFEGKDIEMNNLKGNVLLMSNVTVHHKHYDGLIYLAKRYYDYGLKILVFLCDRLNENQNPKVDNSKCEEQFGDQYENNDDVENKKEEENKVKGLNFIDSTLIGFMNEFMNERENKIVNELSEYNVTIIDKIADNGNEAHDLWKYMEYTTKNEISSNPISPITFLVDKDGNNIKEFNVEEIYHEINVYSVEVAIVNLLRPWESADNVYGFILNKLNDYRMSMNEYSGKVLFVIKLDYKMFSGQLNVLYNLAEINYKYGFIILAFIENSNYKLCAEMIKSSYVDKIHIFEFDVLSSILWKYIHMNIKKDMDPSSSNTKIIEQYIIDKEGKVVNGFSVKNAIKNLLRPWESANNVYGFELYKLSGDRMSMNEYSGKVLFVIKLQSENVCNQLILLHNLADIYYIYGLIIFVFIEDTNNQYCAEIIKSSYDDKIHIFKFDDLSSILWKYIHSTSFKNKELFTLYDGYYPPITPKIESYMIDKEGKVVKSFPMEKLNFKFDQYLKGVNKYFEEYFVEPKVKKQKLHV